MKKLFLVGLCMISPAAFAAGVAACTNGTPNTISAGGATDFVKISFAHKCSANVYAAVEQNNIAFAAAGGSGKGKNVFGGSSGGGAVTGIGPCAATGCTGTEPAAATAALLAAAT